MFWQHRDLNSEPCTVRQTLYHSYIPALLVLVIFEIRSCIYARSVWTRILFMLPVAGVTGARHHVQLLLAEMRSHELAAPASLEPRSS
jgi:hypothetical protein